MVTGLFFGIELILGFPCERIKKNGRRAAGLVHIKLAGVCSDKPSFLYVAILVTPTRIT